MMRRHAELLVAYMGEERGCKEFRKHIAWYLKGFARRRRASSVAGARRHVGHLDVLLVRLDPTEPFPVGRARQPAWPAGQPASASSFPRAGCSDRDGLTVDAAAEIGISGG